MVEEEDSRKKPGEIPPEVKKVLLKAGWTPPEPRPSASIEVSLEPKPEVPAQAQEQPRDKASLVPRGGGGEGQASNTTSEVPTRASEYGSEPGNKEYTEVETKQNSAKISANKTSEVPTTSPTEVPKKFVCKECGKSFDTKKKLDGHMSAHSKKSTSETTKKEEKEETREEIERQEALRQEEKKPLAPYEEVEPADEFLRKFLNEFALTKQFIELLCRKTKRRNALPHPNDLAADIDDMDSGIGNTRSANYIAEEYSYELKDYLKKLKDTNKPRDSMGYDVNFTSPPTDQSHTGHGISLDDYKKEEGQVRDSRRDREKEKEKTSVDPVKEALKEYRARKAERILDLMSTRELADIERELSGEGEEEEKHTLIVDGVSLKLTTEELLSWKHYIAEEKKAEEERKRAIERQSQNDGELIDWVVGEGNNTRTIKVRPENIPLLTQAQGANNPKESSLSREDVTQMVLQTIDAQTKKLTSEDVEGIVQRVMGSGDHRPGLTKNDLVYLEARDKLHLEEKKLDESGKTRDVIATEIRSGFDHAGKIISRMMTGEGETAGLPVEGRSDQAGAMMQVPCPKSLGGCGATITAPIGSPNVVCSSCGRRWTVEPQGAPPPPANETPVAPPVPPSETLPPPANETLPPPANETLPPVAPPKETPAGAGFSVEQQPPMSTEPTPPVEKPVEKPEEPMHVKPEEPSKDIKKIAENLVIGEGVKKLEEELKKEKKPMPEITSNKCPICGKKCKSKGGVRLHAEEVHPEYEQVRKK